ncbi:hypothetical protein H0E87_030380 [Populus deltoides]|uniref:Secreted protein n=1 Tax=Populus deltoides TaxID=3696 RepID=A0A8T2WET2_POPDE|nr:hypothetical protein H0E87_030380 [Populus deltoides]
MPQDVLGLVRDLLALLVLGAYLHDNSGFGVELQKRSCASSSLFDILANLATMGGVTPALLVDPPWWCDNSPVFRALPIEIVQCQLRLAICPENSSLLQTISIPELCLVA